ncbi:glycerol kinase GlpK [Oleiharenicola lentus]|uniref:ATP:glycerol 3-phosphotransferase n=1 Tax=Oleiharenicola lentus TaxID=2508720 RepID=A0A4Q1C5B7_9BACT|nr:glycerol kinase GlpK [Oleiharenicola lentus]RXK53591.1 glycerol kinase GlpK [Oleiharenicola lentus]
MPLFLALDQSTSATKALLFDAAGHALDRESRDHVQHYPQPGWVEHDAEEIWQNTLTVLRTLLARNPDKVGEIAALSITNQRETILVFERGTGRPLHRALVWQDRRGDGFCAAAKRHESLVHRTTGLKIDGYFSASKLQWLVHNQPGLKAKLADGSALIGTIDAYLIYRLTGGQVFATDTTNASRTLLYDIGRLAWNDELCALWEVPRRALPEVRDCSASFGETTLSGELVEPLPICGVMGDSQASLFAQRCYAPGAAKVTFGTGSSLLLNIGDTPRFSAQGVLTALAWSHAGRPTYAFEGIIISSASTLTWLRDQLGLAADVPAIEQLALAVPDNGGVHLVPAFTGLGLPHWRPDARAAILGLSSHSDRRHVARAAFESIAFQVRDALDAMRAEAGVPLTALHGDGGPTASKFLMQFCADLCGVDLRVATMPDCSPLGAVLAGQLGLGLQRDLAGLAALTRDEVIYQPKLAAEKVAALHDGWRQAVGRTL